eukprot:s159_g33.t1
MKVLKDDADGGCLSPSWLQQDPRKDAAWGCRFRSQFKGRPAYELSSEVNSEAKGVRRKGDVKTHQLAPPGPVFGSGGGTADLLLEAGGKPDAGASVEEQGSLAISWWEDEAEHSTGVLSATLNYPEIVSPCMSLWGVLLILSRSCSLTRLWAVPSPSLEPLRRDSHVVLLDLHIREDIQPTSKGHVSDVYAAFRAHVAQAWPLLMLRAPEAGPNMGQSLTMEESLVSPSSMEGILLSGLSQSPRWTDLGVRLDEAFTASDASEGAGGMVYGAKFTPHDLKGLHALDEGLDDPISGPVSLDEEQVILALSGFGSSNGLLRTLQLAKVPVDRLVVNEQAFKLFHNFCERFRAADEICTGLEVWAIARVENVIGDETDIEEMFKVLGAHPLIACAISLLRVRRPRRYWAHVILEDHPTCIWARHARYAEVSFEEEMGPLEKDPDERWSCPAAEENEEQNVPGFTRVTPHKRPPSFPVGLSQCVEEMGVLAKSCPQSCRSQARLPLWVRAGALSECGVCLACVPLFNPTRTGLKAHWFGLVHLMWVISSTMREEKLYLLRGYSGLTAEPQYGWSVLDGTNDYLNDMFLLALFLVIVLLAYKAALVFGWHQGCRFILVRRAIRAERFERLLEQKSEECNQKGSEILALQGHIRELRGHLSNAQPELLRALHEEQAKSRGLAREVQLYEDSFFDKNQQLIALERHIRELQEVLRGYESLRRSGHRVMTRAYNELEHHHNRYHRHGEIFVANRGTVWHWDGTCYKLQNATVRELWPCTSCANDVMTPHIPDEFGVSL